VSDPTTPPSGDDRENSVPSENTPVPDSEPIDVNELLESTRKLFEPEQLQRSMEQAGYTPESPAETPHEPGNHAPQLDLALTLDTTEQTKAKAETSFADKNLDDGPTVESGAISDNSEGGGSATDQTTVDDRAEGDDAPVVPPLKGVNVLSVVAMILAISLSPLAVVFGYIALGQTRRARQRGETLALWAIGLGWIVFAAWVVLIVSLLWIGYQQGITLDSLREFIELFSLP
jgi:hypothetical protein